MKLFPDCGYFNEEKHDEYSPYPRECEDCYRYDICLKAYKNRKEKRMVNILVNCKTIEEAIYTCKFISDTLFSRGISIKKIICKNSRCEFQTNKVFVKFIVHKDSDNLIRGRRCNIVYGFSRDDSLYLTRGKNEKPTLPLLDRIIQIEKGELLCY